MRPALRMRLGAVAAYGACGLALGPSAKTGGRSWLLGALRAQRQRVRSASSASWRQSLVGGGGLGDLGRARLVRFDDAGAHGVERVRCV